MNSNKSLVYPQHQLDRLNTPSQLRLKDRKHGDFFEGKKHANEKQNNWPRPNNMKSDYNNYPY